ncbi:MAG: class I SAM-dependent methyltransferase [Phycisphaerae bacterium]
MPPVAPTTFAPTAPVVAGAGSVDRKTRLKFLLRRLVGEVYAGKRMKMRHLTRIVRALPRPAAPRVLEVGCEDGTFSEWLSRLFPHAVIDAIDVDAEQVAANQRWAAAAGLAERIRFAHLDVLDFARESAYDLATAFDVLGYIPDDRAAVRRMAASLRPGGHLVIHQPNTTYVKLDGSAEYVPPERAGLITHGHVRHGYSPAELAALLAGDPRLEVVSVRSLHGRLTDLAYRIYLRLERPAPLRLLSLPLVDLLCEIDRRVPQRHGNTVCAVARRR